MDAAMLEATLEFLVALLMVALVGGSLLNLSSHPHWFVRGWEFPRLQIITIALILVASVVVLQLLTHQSLRSYWSWTVYGSAAFLCLWHGYWILPYSPLWPRQTQDSVAEDRSHAMRLIISNVEMKNEQFDQWMKVLSSEDPDVILALETDRRWVDSIAPLAESYPHQVLQPQDNCYGMLILSRYRILDSKVRFLIQDDIPSIDAMIELPSGDPVRVIAVHPRPPEPMRGHHATSRDAELMIYGEELADVKQPVILGGDLNDVAWSRTTRLFLRVSEMLDPRRGRGLYNTFHAKQWYMRFPLDHVFHSEHFTLRQLRRLDQVGSDHFPILIELQLNRSRRQQQESLDADGSDHDFAEELIERP